HGSTSLCFFFQAEDGIRDFHVTGVQTCALPISASAKHLGSKLSAACSGFQQLLQQYGNGYIAVTRRRYSRSIPARQQKVCHTARSEERRVGKEWRSRWATDD